MTTREPLRIQVREDLLTRILDGSYQPGDPIRELEVAARLGVSQSPVREALRELAAAGLAEYTPNRGTRVRAIRAADLEQYYPVRAALEGLAGSLAAPALAGSTAVLTEAIAQMHEAARTTDLLLFARASTAFHRHIIEATDNRVLADAWNALGVEIFTAVSLATTDDPLARLADEHWPVVHALDRGDARAASRELRAHVAGYGSRARPTRRRAVDPGHS